MQRRPTKKAGLLMQELIDLARSKAGRMLVTPALLVAVGFAAAAASAQDYPARNMTLVVPLAAGGSADIVARLLAQSMSELLGRTIVVENVSGAGGMIGASRVAKAPPDGYQILLGTVGSQALSQTLYRAPLYDSRKDFEPVGLAVDVPIILQVKNGFPADKPSAVIEYLKAHRSKVSYASPGTGTTNHLACALFNAAIGIGVTHVPYRAAADLFGDMIAGRLDYWCLTTTAAAPMIQANQVKTILAFSPQRLETLPDVPTASEAGLANLEAGTWFGLFLPKGSPASVVSILNDALGKTLEKPQVQAILRETGATVVTHDRRSPEYLSRFVASEVDKWRGPIKTSGISM
jgi:tripartite-type tricarboxylate transporter receptor subunit TctC